MNLKIMSTILKESIEHISRVIFDTPDSALRALNYPYLSTLHTARGVLKEAHKKVGIWQEMVGSLR